MISRAEPIWLVVAAVLQLGTYFCTAVILKLGLRRSGTRVRMRSLVPLGLVKLFIDQVVPTGGIAGTVLIIRALQRRGVPVGLSTAAVVVSLLGFYLAYAVSVALCLVVFWIRSHLSPVILSAVTIVWSSPRFMKRSPGVSRLPKWVRAAWLPGALLLAALIAVALRYGESARFAEMISRAEPIWLVVAAVLQLAIILLDAATLRAMLLALGYYVPPAVAFASFVLASVIATVSLLPGGVGPFEAGSVGTLRVLGVPLEVAVAATLLLRGFTLWLPMLPGLWLARREMVKQAE
jgi:uncharacterized membrane protein YbhN (UPF0104 family)